MSFLDNHTRVVLITLALAVLAPGTSALAENGAAGKPYACEENLIEVMFAEDSRVRLRDGGLIDLATNALEGVDQVLGNVTWHEWHRICDVLEETLDEIQVRGEANTGRPVYNLNNIYRLRFGTDVVGVDVWTLSRELEALPGIMLARPVPLPMPLPMPPDYEPNQGYLDPAASTPTGIDAEYAWTQPGGDGSGITVVDIEYSWNYNHDDDTKALGSQINSFVQDPFNDNNHGTAVIGELISDDNGPNWGTKGSCYGASLLTCGSYFGTPAPGWNVPGALAVAIAHLNAGDVIILEQQWDYTGSGGYVPIEWWLDSFPNPQSFNGVYAAIVNAVSNGIYVVEAGGNGGINTDTMTWFGDSGAIIVGAGGAYPGGIWPGGDLERLSFSSYGARFNLQGWGEDVVTTGYGDLFNLEGVDRWYTSQFSGTSSASPNVAGAVACCAGYFRANLTMNPMTPAAMRSLLVSTGTPQVFGPAGNIGPRPDCRTAIAAMGAPQYDGDWGDAPEGALAYPSAGGMGFFPTCSSVGAPGSYVLHLTSPPYQAYFGPTEDYENNGNAGNCPNFPPYDADECFQDGDAGLLFPGAFTIQGGVEVPCAGLGAPVGTTCMTAQWGGNLDIDVTNSWGTTVYVNVLMDWDWNGMWQGSSQCQGIGPAPEHVLVNFPVPSGYAGPLSALAPPSFLTGPNHGFFWARFTVSETQVPHDWDGVGVFEIGETEDYFLIVVEDLELSGDLGDAPEGGLAYPSTGVLGQFPTCFATGPAGYVIHFPSDIFAAYFGNLLDYENEGNAGNCPNFPPYDADECFNDGDAGLMTPRAYTIQGGLVVPCSGAGSSLGNQCQAAVWGFNVDIWVDNQANIYDAYVNVLMDWNQDGRWQGASQCPGGAAPEHVLWNFQVPAGFAGPLSVLGPPPFMIGPNGGYVWTRFTIGDMQVPFNWNGHWLFGGGESEDYLLHVEGEEAPYGEYGDAPEGALAYPWLGVNGRFPTCFATGPVGFVYHQPLAWSFFGPMADFENEGNAGNCPNFPPYDADECFNDPDAGLIFPPAYTIDAALNVVPCDPTQTGPLGITCQTAVWGVDVDIFVTNNMPVDGFVNVLMDWNQSGNWQGSSQCPAAAAPEHVLVNFPVPMGFSGPLSGLNPPAFLIGPNLDYIWTRFTVSESTVPQDWNGAASFEDGETCDYLLLIDPGQPPYGEYGDAPEGAIAYPYIGVNGQFPTCSGVGPAGFVVHSQQGATFFGPLADFEPDGNAGNCPNFPPYDADECFIDGDAGLLRPPVYTIDASLNVVPCPGGGMGPLGGVCATAVWGVNVDIDVTNNMPADAFVNVLMDWDADGQWTGSSQCPGGPAAEHVLVNFLVPTGYSGPLSALGPPPFLIGPNPGYAWSRFTVSEVPVPQDWNGEASFDDGETEDYLLLIREDEAEYGDAPEGAMAYPSLGVIGQFPTCTGVGPAGFVYHWWAGAMGFGPGRDTETNGNAGNCPNFPPYDADECFNDGDAGLIMPPAYTIDNNIQVVPCDTSHVGRLGVVCATAQWGIDVDIHVTNASAADGFVNVLMDWNHDGQWQGSSQCPGGPAPEHVLVNFLVPPGFIGPLSGLGPPPFTIGPDSGFVWTRFTIAEHPVPDDWNGEDSFEDGETEDFLLRVDEPPPTGACCFPEAACQIMTLVQCSQANGNYQGDYTTCDPNPCPYDQQRVCCVGDDCQLVWSELECVNLSGEFHPEYLTCLPNPCTECIHWATHDVGDCELTVTDQGIIGFMDDTQAEGDGFIYPAGGDNTLFLGTLWVGIDSTYVANRDYTADPNIEWAYSVVPLGCIWIDENGLSHQDMHAAYRDNAGADSLNLFVRQDSWAWSHPDPADDFVILRYAIHNESNESLSGLYGGVFCDFDIGETYTDDEGAVEADHRLVYVTDTDGLHTGVVQLERGGQPVPLANLTLVHNPTFVWPNTYMLDADKIGFLSAADSAHILTQSPEPDDYSVLASSGPFNLEPGASDTLAFAIVGGMDLYSIKQNALVAQLTYDEGWAGIDDPIPGPITITQLLPSRPNPFRGTTTISLDLSRPQSVTVGIYDVSGRLVRMLMRGSRQSGHYNIIWDGQSDAGRSVAGGVYFLRMSTGETLQSRPLILLR